MINLVLVAIILAFVLWEIYAHFIRHNKDAHTLSYDIRHWEDISWWHIGLLVRIVAGVSTVVLLFHLENWHL